MLHSYFHFWIRSQFSRFWILNQDFNVWTIGKLLKYILRSFSVISVALFATDLVEGGGMNRQNGHCVYVEPWTRTQKSYGTYFQMKTLSIKTGALHVWNASPVANLCIAESMEMVKNYCEQKRNWTRTRSNEWTSGSRKIVSFLKWLNCSSFQYVKRITWHPFFSLCHIAHSMVAILKYATTLSACTGFLLFLLSLHTVHIPYFSPLRSVG